MCTEEGGRRHSLPPDGSACPIPFLPCLHTNARPHFVSLLASSLVDADDGRAVRRSQVARQGTRAARRGGGAPAGASCIGYLDAHAAGSAGRGEAAQASTVTGAARIGGSSATRSQRQWSILSHLVGRHYTDTISEWLHGRLRGSLLGSLRHRLTTLSAYARARHSSPSV